MTLQRAASRLSEPINYARIADRLPKRATSAEIRTLANCARKVVLFTPWTGAGVEANEATWGNCEVAEGGPPSELVLLAQLQAVVGDL